MSIIKFFNGINYLRDIFVGFSNGIKERRQVLYCRYNVHSEGDSFINNSFFFLFPNHDYEESFQICGFFFFSNSLKPVWWIRINLYFLKEISANILVHNFHLTVHLSDVNTDEKTFRSLTEENGRWRKIRAFWITVKSEC